ELVAGPFLRKHPKALDLVLTMTPERILSSLCGDKQKSLCQNVTAAIVSKGKYSISMLETFAKISIPMAEYTMEAMRPHLMFSDLVKELYAWICTKSLQNLKEAEEDDELVVGMVVLTDPLKFD